MLCYGRLGVSMARDGQLPTAHGEPGTYRHVAAGATSCWICASGELTA